MIIQLSDYGMQYHCKYFELSMHSGLIGTDETLVIKFKFGLYEEIHDELIRHKFRTL